MESDRLQWMAETARYLAEAHTVDQTLERLVVVGQTAVPGCEGASIMLVGRGGKVTTPVFSNEVARAADEAQYEAGEGPCLTAISNEHTTVIDDMAAEDRWPAFRREMERVKVGSMISYRLFMSGDTMGALNLYGSQAGAFTQEDRWLGEVFASHAAVALNATITESGLEAAIESRDVIGQAKGVLMERRRLSADGAFDLLRRLSQQRNVPVREVAREIAETGEIPDLPDQD